MKSPKYAGEAIKQSKTVRSEKAGGASFPKMTAGAASGLGRLQKCSAYGGKKGK